MTNAFTHRNHYIPQQYQLGFANDLGRVWLFDRETLQFRNSNPVDIGIRRDFYTTVDAGGIQNDLVEKVLALLEGVVWPVIDSLERGATEISADDRAHLALFASLMKTRTPVFDYISNSTNEQLLKWSAKARTPTLEALAQEYARVTGQAIDQREAETLHKVIQEDAYVVETPRQNTIKMMLQIAVTLSEALITLDWTIYKTPLDFTFLTSDNPFIVIPAPNHDHTLSGAGPLSKGATSLVPLSKTLLLAMGHNGKGFLRHVKAGRDFVRYANQTVTRNCDRFLIGRDEAHLRKIVQLTKIDQWKNDFSPVLIVPDPIKSE